MGTLEDAVAMVIAGDVDALRAQIDRRPDLVRARTTSAEGHYCGYFHGATLLHHVAGNPMLAPLPPAILEVAVLLLDRGAAVDETTLAGPSQPDDIGWTTLGLVATSLAAREAGQQSPLLELLASRGADVNAKDGGALIGALYYREDAAAAWLVDHGARTDLVAAAGLGRIELMAPHVGPSGELREGARTLVDYAQRRGAVRSARDVLSLALVYATRAGRLEAMRWLIGRGADPRAPAPFDHGATPLHWAAMEGQREAAEVLLASGADATLRDETFRATPRGWAEHAGHDDVAALLPPDA